MIGLFYIENWVLFKFQKIRSTFLIINRGISHLSQMYIDGSKEGDFIFVKIESIRNNYLFSIDNNQTQYFVHSNQYKGDINWYKLKEGELLKVHPLPADSSQSAVKVKAALVARLS